jgi:hypothetical protein
MSRALHAATLIAAALSCIQVKHQANNHLPAFLLGNKREKYITTGGFWELK